MAFIPLILKRATRRLALLFILALGVVLSTGLLASAPILINTVIEFGLPRRLHAANVTDPLSANLRLSTFANLGETDYQQTDDNIQAILQNRFGTHLDQIVSIVQSHWMFPWLEDIPIDNERINFRYVQGIEDKVEWVAGAWPATRSGGELNGVISEEMAAYYHLQVGSELSLSFNHDASEPDLIITVSGIIRPKNASDPYWMGAYSPLKSQGNKRYVQQYGVILPADSFFPLLTELFPRSRSELSWHVLINPDSVTTTGLPALINRLTLLSNDFDKTIAYETGLRDLLLAFYSQTQDIRVPIYLLTSEIVLLALAYVVMTAAQHVRTIESEFATLRSRGASGGQIIRIQLAEATMIALVAVLSGPGLGAQLVALVERIGPLADLSSSQMLMTTTQAAWTATLVGAGACIVSLIAPVFPALRRSIVMYTQTTGRLRKPLWQRLYLDVALLALGLTLLFRLQIVGGIGQGTGGRVDWLLLLSPLTLLLGAATLIVRLAPPVLGLISRAVTLGRGLSAPLAFWQTARNPNQFAGIVLLLTLANALGILSVGLNSTLDASEFERARYAVGGDIRLGTERGLTGAYNLPQVTNAATTIRASGAIDLKSARSFPAFDILGIDPIKFSKVTVYRKDFSDEPMGELLGKLITVRDKLPGIELPGEPGEIGVWIFAPDDSTTLGAPPMDGASNRDRVRFEVKILSSNGSSFLLPLEDTTPPCPAATPPETDPDAPPCTPPPWAYFTAPLPDLTPNDYPLSLHSIWMRNRARINGEPVNFVNLMVALDDFGVTDRQTGETSIVEDFEDPVRIVSHEFRTPSGTDNSIFSYTKTQSYSGEASGRMNLFFTGPLQYVGLIFNIAERDNPILPALVSPRFLEASELSVGDIVNANVREQALLFEIKGVVRYFPSMYEEKDAGFLITSQEALLFRLGNNTPLSINPNEIWLDMAPGAGLADIPTNEATQIWDTETLRQAMKADPLALGLRSITFLGYLLTTLLSIIGFATHFTLSVRQRSTSFGILRAMGMSPGQLYGSLALEQSLIILTGLGLGALLGAVLNQIVIPGLPITLADQIPIPPFIPITNWDPIRQVFVTLILIFALTFGAATWFLWRGKVHQALRIGQE